LNNTVLITGTSSGLGRATAKHFHDKGWNVVATMRTAEKEAELTKLDRVLNSSARGFGEGRGTASCSRPQMQGARF
jgi:NAD(P)-dependent dehydrogenase (short-subunit alcohol dehydrogenase family)